MSHTFDDPSIISLGGEPPSGSGSALSKLLDSAIANASAEFATPEQPIALAQLFAALKLDQVHASLEQSIIDDPIPSLPKNPACVYSLDRLYELRASPMVPVLGPELPEAVFWRLKTKQPAQPGVPQRREWANPERGERVERVERGDRQSRRSRTKSRVNREEALEALESEEAAPDWDDVNTASTIDMGKTVEDFEKWRAQMRLKERKLRGEEVGIEEDEILQQAQRVATLAGSALEGFFAMKSSASDSDANASGRFSSFFTPAVEGKAPVTEPSALEGDRVSSRFLAMTQRSSPHQQVEAQRHSANQSTRAPEPPRASDSFFQSLMKKGKDEEESSSPATPRQLNLMSLFGNSGPALEKEGRPGSEPRLALTVGPERKGSAQQGERPVSADPRVALGQAFPPGPRQAKPNPAPPHLPVQHGQSPYAQPQGLQPQHSQPQHAQLQQPHSMAGYPHMGYQAGPPGYPLHGYPQPSLNQQSGPPGFRPYPATPGNAATPQGYPQMPPHLQQMPPHMNPQFMGQIPPQFRQAGAPHMNFPPGFMNQFSAPDGSQPPMPMNGAAYPPGYGPPSPGFVAPQPQGPAASTPRGPPGFRQR